MMVTSLLIAANSSRPSGSLTRPCPSSCSLTALANDETHELPALAAHRRQVVQAFGDKALPLLRGKGAQTVLEAARDEDAGAERRTETCRDGDAVLRVEREIELPKQPRPLHVGHSTPQFPTMQHFRGFLARPRPPRPTGIPPAQVMQLRGRARHEAWRRGASRRCGAALRESLRAVAGRPLTEPGHHYCDGGGSLILRPMRRLAGFVIWGLRSMSCEMVTPVLAEICESDSPALTT